MRPSKCLCTDHHADRDGPAHPTGALTRARVPGPQIVPTREAFLAQLAPEGAGNVLMPQLAAFLAAFRPVLAAIAAFLESHGLDFDAQV